ncbi:hypothetical protein KBD20_02135 [Candidatus Saccharibacteria bacterium]|nr:hypothetical protein [Candidatus Saccharibacteria bacterium]
MEDVITPTAEEQDQRASGATSTDEGSTEAAIAADLGFGSETTTAEISTDGTEAESDADTELIGDLGETSLGAALSLESDDESVPIPETALPKDEAEEAAEAMKPFLKQKEAQADKLTPENNDLLDWLASEAAKQAVTDYIEGKTKMGAAETLLREKAGGFKELHKGMDVETAVGRGDVATGRSTEEKVEILADADSMLDKVIEHQLDQILGDDELSTQDKISRVEALKWTQSEASQTLANTSKLDSAESIVRNLGGHGSQEAVAGLWGNVIAATVGGYIHQAIGSLERIADLTGEDPHDIIKIVLPEISKGASDHNTGSKSSTDSLMERHGYLWSNGTSGIPRGYVKIS